MTTEATERPPATVVTSENLAEFNSARMGLKDPLPSEEEPGEIIGEVEEPGEAPAPKPKGKINERMSELTAQRKEEAARREAAELRATAAERERDELRARLNPPAPAPAPAADPGEPKPGDFTDAFEYGRAVARWEVKQELKAQADAKVREEQQAEGQKVVSAFTERVNATKAELADYDDIVGSSTVQVSDPVRDALMTSPVGPKLMYKLAADPSLAESLGKMTVIDQLMTIGEWASELRKPAAPAAAPAAAAPSAVFRAPAPIVPVRGTKTADVPVDSKGEFTGTPAEYRAARKAGKI